jgi:hypothetical protein
MKQSTHCVKSALSTILVATAAIVSNSALAADWSDTYIGYRYGTDYREPFNPNDIHKNGGGILLVRQLGRRLGRLDRVASVLIARTTLRA